MAALSAIYWGMWAATQAWPRTLSSADFTYAQEEDIDSLVHDRKMEQKQIPLFLLEGNMGLEQSVMNEAFLRIKEWNLQCPHRFLDIGCIQVKPCPWNLYSLTLISVPDIWVGAPEQDALYEALCSLRSIHDILRYEFHSDLHIPPTVIKEEIYPASADSSEQITPKNDGSDNLAKAAGDPSTSKEGDNLFEYWHPALQQLHIELNKPNRSLHCLNVEKPSSFRVTATRYSANRAFTSQDVARVAGDALYERYSIAVRMKNYDVNVRVLMFGLDRILVAHQLTSESLSRRHKEVYVNHVTTRSNIAYVIYAQASIQPGNKVLDPFCGSATILLEALSASRNAIECHGVDYSPKAIRGASNNASIEGVEKYCTFYKGDGRTLHKLFEPNTFDAIITNPPWGVRSGQSTDLEQLYAIFLQEAARVIKPGGRMVVFLLKAMHFVELVRLSGKWKILDSFVIKTRNNLPTMFVLQQRDDVEKERIHSQLSTLAHYCNLSSDLYWSIRNKEGANLTHLRQSRR